MGESAHCVMGCAINFGFSISNRSSALNISWLQGEFSFHFSFILAYQLIYEAIIGNFVSTYVVKLICQINYNLFILPLLALFNYFSLMYFISFHVFFTRSCGWLFAGKYMATDFIISFYIRINYDNTFCINGKLEWEMWKFRPAHFFNQIQFKQMFPAKTKLNVKR